LLRSEPAEKIEIDMAPELEVVLLCPTCYTELNTKETFCPKCGQVFKKVKENKYELKNRK